MHPITAPLLLNLPAALLSAPLVRAPLLSAEWTSVPEIGSGSTSGPGLRSGSASGLGLSAVEKQQEEQQQEEGSKDQEFFVETVVGPSKVLQKFSSTFIYYPKPTNLHSLMTLTQNKHNN